MIINNDALTALKILPDASVQMCVTSPPYYALRDYGCAGQIGLEDTPEEYIGRLVAVFREVRRVLKDNGTLWVVIGDSYCGSGKNSGGRNDDSLQATSAPHSWATGRTKAPGLKPKDLIGIPWALAFALRADGWYLRQDIIWVKPNPIPESVTDRFTKSHEHILFLSKSQKYYFDQGAVLEIAAYDGRKDTRAKGCHKYYREGIHVNNPPQSMAGWGGVGHERWRRDSVGNYLRNKRDVWTVSTEAYHNAHFATFPTALIRPCILAGSWPGDVVLDPFFGAGTTGLVAAELKRDFIGIEINAEYCELARQRLSGAVFQEELQYA
jgi:DNA modification methylase